VIVGGGKPSFHNVATATTIFKNVAREMTMSQTWKERRLCGKCGKRDDNVARETTMWKETHQHGNSDVIRQYGKKIKISSIFDSMANFVHNSANITSKCIQNVLVSTTTCVMNCVYSNIPRFAFMKISLVQVKCIRYCPKYLIQFYFCNVKEVFNMGFTVPRSPSQFLYIFLVGGRPSVLMPQILY
jgi:hypothetical protein